MAYLFFFIYLILICWLLSKIKFIRNSGISLKTILLLFLLRIATGVVNGYINLYYYSNSDISVFNKNGLDEYHLLLQNPKEYFTNIFQAQHNDYSGLFDTTHSFWNNLRSNIINKLLSIFDIFSQGNFFINIIFYNFLIFFASVLLYKIFIKIYPDKKNILITALFLLPSLLYFTSGIHRDGLIFLSIALVIYNFYHLLNQKVALLKRGILILLSLSLIFVLRNFVFITIFPALIAWAFATKYKQYALQIYLCCYLFFGIIFFTLGFANSKLNLPQYVSARQIEFIQIGKTGNSTINVNPLLPTFESFLFNTPQALNHSLLRPYLTEKFTLLYIPIAIEIFIYQLLFLLFLFFHIKNRTTDPLIYYCIFFSISMFLIIGYTIPIIGAIVRYRSIYLPLILIPIICNIDWKKLKEKINIIK